MTVVLAKAIWHKLSLFSNLDKLLAPNRPCHNSLWVSILALHKALSDRPTDLVVVAAFSLAVNNDPSGLDAEALEAEIVDLAKNVRGTILQMTNVYFVSQATADYPQAPASNLVFIPIGLSIKVCNIFYRIRASANKKNLSKQSRKIDYESLARGDLLEVRHVFARIVFDTLYPLHQNHTQSRNSCISQGG
ncbi:hypothetical protein VNO78_02292 [Psophocarpus tetragonolobus]|uniref:Uncharacterized protein n=1 Tax=Psophocarpus tetragonolobus TaxID=3891 RepID=A0AAN9SZT6_PSOTE